MYRLDRPLNEQYSKPSFAAAPVSAPLTSILPVQPVEDEYYFEEEIERKRGVSIWLVLLIAIAVIALALFGVYKFYPATFNKLSQTYNRITGKTDTVIPVYRHEIKADTLKKDTVNKAAPAEDTATLKSKAPAASPATTKATDTVKHSRWEVIESSFRQLARVNAEIKRLKTFGIDAHLVTDAPGPLLKVSVGTFSTFSEAEAAKLTLVKAGKISKTSQTLEIIL